MDGRITRVLLVDDHALYREGLRGLIDRWDDFEVVGEADNGEEAVVLTRSLVPDLVLMDIQMPVMDGVEATGIICKEHPETAVVILTVSADDGYLVESIRNGARGYILKNTHARQLKGRLLDVLQGDAALSGEAVAMVFELVKNREGTNEAQAKEEAESFLTEHERLLLHYVALGESNKEIGAKLFLGESAVKKQLSAVMFKLGFTNRVQAAVFAVRAGLAD